MPDCQYPDLVSIAIDQTPDVTAWPHDDQTSYRADVLRFVRRTVWELCPQAFFLPTAETSIVLHALLLPHESSVLAELIREMKGIVAAVTILPSSSKALEPVDTEREDELPPLHDQVSALP
jgi:hypothetical protein